MQNNKQHNYDVVIVGGGIAGLYAALNLDKNLKVLLITKRELSLCNSSLAQGGIATVFDPENDSFNEHIQDTLKAGSYENNQNHVSILVKEGPLNVNSLIQHGVEFDKNESGEIHLTLEGGHSKPRILHYKDSTGKEIIDKLILSVKSLSNITVCSEHILCDIKKQQDTFGLDILTPKGEHKYIGCHFALMCTGGIGRVYEYTTNSSIATGDGITLCYKLGAKIKDLHLVQFHPTAFANKRTRESFLISEAVRGEGAILLNCFNERFMQKYDERKELAPRDVVSKAIIQEAKRTNSDDFYLDITHKDSAYIKSRFPMIYQSLLKEGFDMTKDKIPIFPCQHYLMGGVLVDENSKTTIDGLYACGECSNTGVHGNNRLASNSLLEAIVFARRAANQINAISSDKKQQPFANVEFKRDNNTQHIFHGIRTEVRAIMQNAYFVTPNYEVAKKGYKRIKELLEQIKKGGYIIDQDYIEAHSLATIAYLILKEVYKTEDKT